MSGYIGNIPVPQATQTRQSFTATASQTTFNTAGYSPGYIDVFLNGVKLAPADYTATNGSDVVLAVGAASGDILETVAYEIFQVLDQDFTGDFTVDGSTFVVDSTNNRVGIGTTSPKRHLHINDSSAVSTKIQITNSATGSGSDGEGFQLGIGSSGQAAIEQRENQPLTFSTNNTERMRIDSSGNVGIGDSVPLDRLEVKTTTLGGITISSPTHNYAALSFARNSTATARIFISEPAALHTSAIHLQTSDASGGPNLITAMTIDQNQNVGIGTTSPSQSWTGGTARTVQLQGPSSTITALRVNEASDTYGDLQLISGASNEVALYNFNNGAMRLGTNGAERMRIDSSGNLLVDTTSTSIVGSGGFAAKPQGSGVRLDISNSGGAAMLLDRRTNDGDIISFYKDGTTVGSIGVTDGDNLVISSTATDHAGLKFNNTAMGAYVNGASSDGTMDIGTYVVRFKDLYLSGGVFLGGTGASNKLDDYEEGTWTPTVTGSTGGSATLTDASGAYTKIGRMVTVTAEIDINSTNTATGTIRFSNLPFTVANLLSPTGIEAVGVVSFWSSFSTGVNSLGVGAVDGSTYMELYGLTSSTATVTSNISVSAMGNGEVRVTCTYFTT